MASKKDQAMLDPIAYREDYPEEAIIGGIANESFNQFGDDSDLAHQQQSLGGINGKYEGEGTVNYNKDASIKDLPNYVYGRDTAKQGSGYITQRNDNIASALYNEGVTSKDAILSYLASQPGWNNSSEMDRINTVEAIWKRMGQLGGTQSEGTNNQEVDTSKMESDLNKSSNDVIYGKTTADGGNPKSGIKTSNDANLAYDINTQARISAVKSLLTMTTDAIAASIWVGDTPVAGQAIVDYQTWYPQLWTEVKAKLNQLRGQNAVNDITNGNTDYITADVESKERQTENDKKTKAESVASSTEEVSNIISDLNKDLSNSPSATTAEDTMAKLTDDMNKLKTRLKNLRNEANSVFKGDVPDYIVNAYINNRTQEINNRLKELQYDYDAAYQRNRDAIDDAWKWREYGLKQDQLEIQKQQQGFNEWYQRQSIAKSSILKDDNGVYWQININEDGTVYYTKVDQIQNYSNSGMKGKGLKNNNPGNITDGNFGNVIGFDDSGFAIFATPEDGFDALVEKVRYNQTNPNSAYYGMTISQYFNKYAPKLDRNGNPTGNDPDGRAVKCAKALGVSVDTKISDLDTLDFAKFIAQTDSGYNYGTYGQFRKGGVKIDVNDIDVPDSVYIQNNGYMEWKVDPNSDEGKQLAQEYRENRAKELGYNISDTGELVPDADGKGTAAYKVISSDGVTPISYRQRIYNLVPATLKNNETELANLYEIAKQLYSAGYSADEASMVFYGLDPRDDATGLLRPLVYLARTSGKKLGDEFYGNLGSLLETGNSKQAIRLIENTVLADKEKEKEQQASSIVSKIQSLEFQLQNAEKIVGKIDKPLNELIKDWFGNEDYAQLAADIQNTYGQIRNELLGQNMTEGEINMYIDMFPDMSDKVSTIKKKLNSTKKAYIKDINAIRKMYDLPTVNQYTLVDYNLRAELYKQLSANV